MTITRELTAIAEAMADPDHPVKAAASSWAKEHLTGRDLVAADLDCAFDTDGWQRCADHGMLGLLVPAEQGGAGLDLAAALLTLEGLGHGCPDNGLTYAVASQVLSSEYLLSSFGTPEQQERWLPRLIDGSAFAAFCMTEADSGSDAFRMQARAERLDDGSYRLNARKVYLTFAPICDVAIVFASTRPEAGSWGISAFLVDTSLPGVRRGEIRPKMGMRTTPFGDLEFDDVVVPGHALLGREGAGARMFTATLDVERSFVFAPQIGAMQRQLEETIEFANTRQEGGGPIGRHQAVAHRLVAMKERHERARLFMYRAALARTTGSGVAMAASLAKIVGSDAVVGSSLDATTLHGAHGYVTEYEVERAFRDAVGGRSYSGADDVLRNVVARLLGLPAS